MITNAAGPEQRNSRLVAGFFRILAIVMAVIFAGFSVISLALWVHNAQYSALLRWLNLIWLAYAALCAFTLWKLRAARHLIVLVFVFALLPRLALALAQVYTPTNDYQSYWEMGQAFLRGDYADIAWTVNRYRIYDFTGTAVLEGVTAFISGSSYLGTQCLQSVMTSLIAVLIYSLGKRYNERAGLLAAMLYALYPSNIVMTQVTTNQHMAALFALLSILVFLQGLRAGRIYQNVLWGALAGLLLLASQYAHPSSLVTRVAMVLFAVLLCLDAMKQPKRLLGIVCTISACLLAFAVTKLLLDRIMLAAGLRWQNTVRFSYREYILTGTTYETDGQLMGIDQDLRYSYVIMPPAEAYAMIWDRIKNPVRFAGLVVRKAVRLWATMDSSFQWYTDGVNSTMFQHAVATALGSLDMLYVSAAYLLAAAGMFLSRNNMRRLGLMLITLTGWFAVFLLTEVQPRYRYYGMTFIMIFAAVGGVLLLRKFRGFQNRGGCDIL